jgi:pentatricopeptide repeat protein
MAELMGVSPEELAKTMSNTAGVQLDDSEYKEVMKACVKAARAGDVSAMKNALDLLQKMDEVGIRPDVDVYNNVLAACASAADGRFRPCSVNDTAVFSDFVDKAAELVSYSGGRLTSKEFALKWKLRFPKEPLQNYVVDDRGNKRSVSDMLRQSHRFLVEPGPDSYLSKFTLLQQPKKSGKQVKKLTTVSSSWVSIGLDFLARMKANRVKPNAQTYTTVIALCAREAMASKDSDGMAKMYDQANILLNEMRGAGLKPELATYNALMDVCGRCMRTERGEEVLKMLEDEGYTKDAYTFAAIMRLRSQSANGVEDAMSVLDEMKAAGVPPRVQTYNMVLSLLRKHLKTPEEAVTKAWQIWDMMKSDNLQPDQISYVTMIAVLKSGARRRVHNAQQQALDMIEEMRTANQTQNIKAYTSAMSAAGSRRGGQDAIKILEELQAQGGRPDEQAYAAAVRAYARAAQRDGGAAVKKAKELVKSMRKSGHKPGLLVYTALLDAHARATRAPGGRNMISEAYKVLEDMRQNGVAPDTVTYNILINAHAMAGEAGALDSFESAMKVVQKMTGPAKPTISTYNSLIVVAGRSMRGKLKRGKGLEDAFRAYEMMLQQDIVPNLATVNGLMLACQNSAEVGVVIKIAQEHGVQLDATSYALAVRLSLFLYVCLCLERGN